MADVIESIKKDGKSAPPCDQTDLNPGVAYLLNQAIKEKATTFREGLHEEASLAQFEGISLLSPLLAFGSLGGPPLTAFEDFDRVNDEGKIVMEARKVAEFEAGFYKLIDLLFFSDLPPIVPKHTVVRGVTWESDASHQTGDKGRLVFPPGFDGRIQTEVATNNNLMYYGAALATGSEKEIKLLYHYDTMNFTMNPNYLKEYVLKDGKHSLGGACVERHEFHHLDCPLCDDSGHFIIAKFFDDKRELHLTAFKIPTLHTLYLPGGTIHSNDYLKGTWCTMLSDEAPIDQVRLLRKKDEGLEKFHFEFV